MPSTNPVTKYNNRTRVVAARRVVVNKHESAGTSWISTASGGDAGGKNRGYKHDDPTAMEKQPATAGTRVRMLPDKEGYFDTIRVDFQAEDALHRVSGGNDSEPPIAAEDAIALCVVDACSNDGAEGLGGVISHSREKKKRAEIEDEQDEEDKQNNNKRQKGEDALSVKEPTSIGAGRRSFAPTGDISGTSTKAAISGGRKGSMYSSPEILISDKNVGGNIHEALMSWESAAPAELEQTAVPEPATSSFTCACVHSGNGNDAYCAVEAGGSLVECNNNDPSHHTGAAVDIDIDTIDSKGAGDHTVGVVLYLANHIADDRTGNGNHGRERIEGGEGGEGSDGGDGHGSIVDAYTGATGHTPFARRISIDRQNSHLKPPIVNAAEQAPANIVHPNHQLRRPDHTFHRIAEIRPRRPEAASFHSLSFSSASSPSSSSSSPFSLSLSSSTSSDTVHLSAGAPAIAVPLYDHDQRSSHHHLQTSGTQPPDTTTTTTTTTTTITAGSSSRHELNSKITARCDRMGRSNTSAGLSELFNNSAASTSISSPLLPSSRSTHIAATPDTPPTAWSRASSVALNMSKDHYKDQHEESLSAKLALSTPSLPTPILQQQHPLRSILRKRSAYSCPPPRPQTRVPLTPQDIVRHLQQLDPLPLSTCIPGISFAPYDDPSNLSSSDSSSVTASRKRVRFTPCTKPPAPDRCEQLKLRGYAVITASNSDGAGPHHGIRKKSKKLRTRSRFKGADKGRKRDVKSPKGGKHFVGEKNDGKSDISTRKGIEDGWHSGDGDCSKDYHQNDIKHDSSDRDQCQNGTGIVQIQKDIPSTSSPLSCSTDSSQPSLLANQYCSSSHTRDTHTHSATKNSNIICTSAVVHTHLEPVPPLVSTSQEPQTQIDRQSHFSQPTTVILDRKILHVFKQDDYTSLGNSAKIRERGNDVPEWIIKRRKISNSNQGEAFTRSASSTQVEMEVCDKASKAHTAPGYSQRQSHDVESKSQIIPAKETRNTSRELNSEENSKISKHNMLKDQDRKGKQVDEQAVQENGEEEDVEADVRKRNKSNNDQRPSRKVSQNNGHQSLSASLAAISEPATPPGTTIFASDSPQCNGFDTAEEIVDLQSKMSIRYQEQDKNNDEGRLTGLAERKGDFGCLADTEMGLDVDVKSCVEVTA